jgi:hypothetical protein
MVRHGAPRFDPATLPLLTHVLTHPSGRFHRQQNSLKDLIIRAAAESLIAHSVLRWPLDMLDR